MVSYAVQSPMKIITGGRVFNGVGGGSYRMTSFVTNAIEIRDVVGTALARNAALKTINHPGITIKLVGNR